MKIEGHKMLQNFIEEIEVKVKEDKYTQEQIKKLAEVSPKIIELCGKAVIPIIKENGEKSYALEEAQMDIAKKLSEKGTENVEYVALKSAITFSLDALKRENDYRVKNAESNFTNLSSEEKEEIISRDKYFSEALDIFFDIIGKMDQEKIGLIEKIGRI